MSGVTIEVQERPERLDALVEECLREAARPLAERSLSVTHQIGVDLPDHPMDRPLMKEAIHCLLGEAIRSAARGARLRITVKANRSALMLSVKAPGPGLSAVQREILFTGDARPGTLARARAIVDAHGGVAWANGLPGRGATFYVTLPRRCRS